MYNYHMIIIVIRDHSLCTCVCSFVCVFLSFSLCVHACLYVCVCVCVCVCVGAGCSLQEARYGSGWESELARVPDGPFQPWRSACSNVLLHPTEAPDTALTVTGLSERNSTHTHTHIDTHTHTSHMHAAKKPKRVSIANKYEHQ